MMSQRKALLGFVLICAFFCSAVMAPSAFATEETAAFTCVKKAEPGGAGFSKAHCRPADAVASGATFEFKTVPTETSIAFEAKNENLGAGTTETIPAVLTASVSGIKIQITWNGITVTGGSLKLDVFPLRVTFKAPHILFHTPKIDLTLEKICKVKGGEMKTASLEATTVAKSTEIEFKPEVGETVATLELEGAECPFTGVPLKITGSFKAIPNGTTLETTEASSKGLKLGGSSASLVSVTTLRAAEKGNPIGFTTK
jgi:hypothetical protein